MKIESRIRKPGRITPLSLSAVLLCAMFVLPGCSSIPKEPTAAFQYADKAIANAEQERAVEFAPNELSSAREKMAQARLASTSRSSNKDRASALHLAEKALVDAELAVALARDARAQAVNAELSKNNDVLREELQRDDGSN